MALPVTIDVRCQTLFVLGALRLPVPGLILSSCYER